MMGLDTGSLPFVSSLLESLGYRSRGVYDLKQAHDLFKRESSAWGYLLVDTDTLGDRIIDQCRHLMERFSDIRLVAISGALREGGAPPPTPREAFLEKPLGVWSVEAALQRLKGISGQGK